MNALLLISHLLASSPADSVQKQIGVQLYTGFIIPHAPDLRPIAQTRPVGVEVTYSRTALQRAAFERCNCFARVGAYANYITFSNPAELGRTYGAGAFFEPLIRYGKPLSFSVRATAGLAWLTRYYDADRNPRNTFFGAPLNGLLALSASAHGRLGPQVALSVTAGYNHISNGGTRQPNRGMNFPTLAIGMVYTPQPLPYPDVRQWSRPVLTRRFAGRLTPFASVRTLPQTIRFPEQATWLWGLTGTAGYRLSRFNTLSGGVEVVHDGYVRQQARRAGDRPESWQLAVLGGYELWLGQYTFATHLGWNLIQPATVPDGRVFQRYQLLYTLQNRYLLGVGLKAKLNVAEGFDIRLGLRF